MDRATLEAAEKKLGAIRGAEESLKRAQNELRIFNDYAKAGTVWRPSLRLHNGGAYGRDVTIEVVVPFAVIQQQLIYAVDTARRALIHAGGLA